MYMTIIRQVIKYGALIWDNKMARKHTDASVLLNVRGKLMASKTQGKARFILKPDPFCQMYMLICFLFITVSSKLTSEKYFSNIPGNYASLVYINFADLFTTRFFVSTDRIPLEFLGKYLIKEH